MKNNKRKFSFKKQTIILLVIIAVVTISACVIIGFLNENKLIRTEAIVSIVMAGCSLMVSIGSLFISFRQESRNQKFIKDEQEKKAVKFLIDSENDINYIDFCQLYNNVKVFTNLNRKIYNEYFLLEDEVKELVHKQINIDILEFKNNWLEESYEIIESFCHEYKLGELPFTNFYEFKNYIKRLKGKKYIDYGKYENLSNEYSWMNSYDKQKVNFRQFIAQYIYVFDDRLIQILKNINKTPIEYLTITNDIKSSDTSTESLYLYCLYEISRSYLSQENYKCVLDDMEFYLEGIKIENCEDMYFKVLYALYNVSLTKKDNN